jgi:ribosome biogenesis GTPase A
VRSGNQVDTYRMSEILINELRSAKIGRITLETPAMIEAEEIVVAEQRLAAEEKKKAKEEEKRLRRLKTRKNRK